MESKNLESIALIVSDRQFGLSAEMMKKMQGAFGGDVAQALKDSGLKNQCGVAVAIVSMAIAAYGEYSHRTFEVAQDIVFKQSRRIKQYGAGAYPMSEKQIDLIVSQCLEAAKAYKF